MATPSKQRSGFTLIELLAVLTILAILSAAAVVTVRLPIRAARMRLATEQLSLLDQQMREHVRRYGSPGELTFDLERGRIEGHFGDRGSSTSTGDHQLRGVRIDRFRSVFHNRRSGRVGVTFAAGGRAPTYAVRLRTESEQEQWLLFLGLTGQMIETQNEREVTELFRFLSQGRDLD